MYNLLVNLRVLLSLFVITLFPILVTSELWQEVWTGVRPLAWDGSGHYTLAQIYSNTIFPDVFGWTNGFFGGMPHPNNYPPLFYWLIGVLDHSPFFSFSTAFKIVVVLPTLLLPAATWFLAWKTSNKNELIAFCAALVVTPLLVDYRFIITSGPLGITYMSTFVTGLYSHPLGYLFLILWYGVYCDRRQPLWRGALAAFLLACSFLSSFFGASVTALFIVATLVYDVLQLLRSAANTNEKRQARQTLIGHFVSPLIAFCLTLFWLAPVIATRDYIVTQPSSIPLSEMLPLAICLWYAIAATGVILWLRRERRFSLMGIYLSSCFLLAIVVFAGGAASPRWFPLHPARLVATLNFLLAVPVGITVAFTLQRLALLLGVAPLLVRLNNEFTTLADFSPAESSGAITTRTSKSTLVEQTNEKLITLQSQATQLSSWQIIGIVIGLIFGVVILFKGIVPPPFSLTYYPTADRETIDPILIFAKTHQDGRYLVETPPFTDAVAGHEARAINNFLPASGNEVLTLFFREASPNIVFFSPVVDRFSVQADPTGISSVLSDDADFARQNFDLHMHQARLLGVRYLIIRSPWARNMLIGQEAQIKKQHQVGLWSIYELNGEPQQLVRPLLHKPALVVSSLNLKGRRHNESDFVRFAEEQLASGWYDVLLARSSENRLDKLEVEEGFGSLVIDRYECDDEETAFNNLREFSQHRQLVLLESDALLFRRIEAAIADFPQATIIKRTTEEPGEWLKPGAPSRSYRASQLRQTWQQIRQTLDQHKIPIEATAAAAVTGQTTQNQIAVNLSASVKESVPILINTTYHPNWRRNDDQNLYPVTPFFMLAFASEPVQLRFERRTSDWVSVAISAMTLLLISGALAWHYGNRLMIRGVNQFSAINNSEL